MNPAQPNPSQRLLAQARSAELYSDGSQIYNLQRVAQPAAHENLARPAECNSAIQQIANLRYGAGGSRHALLHLQLSGESHSRALTGLFTT
jgi:hypothetical protein